MNNFEYIINTIKALYGSNQSFIPLHAPVFIGNEKKYLEDCIDSTFVSSVGKYVDKFEEVIAQYTGAKKAIVIVNGTNALHLALLSVGVQNDDEVITQPVTFIATANAISYCNAHPVFIDVDRETLGLSPEKLDLWLSSNTIKRENSITKHIETINKNTQRKIAAVVPMHTFGHPCRIDAIIEVCNKYNIPVVEDAAESLGSFYKDQHTGTFGKIGVLSFNGNKIVTTGGGGMILTNDVELGSKIKHLTTQAKVPHAWEFNHDEIGYNYRMPNVNAALGLAQMENIGKFIESKRTTALEYKKQFDSNNISFFTEPKDSKSNYWLNIILLSDRNKRDEFLKYSNSNGVMTRPLWTLMNKLPMFSNCQTDDLSNAKWLEDRIVNIPSSVRL
ncbi:MAG: LegC family aminotransferase [Bacteroidales bacterium]